MEISLKSELIKLTKQYFNAALSHVDHSAEISEGLRKALNSLTLNEDAELPGYEKRNINFGKFENREFVVMMTDIRKSTDIINSQNGLINMFIIFYIYAGIVAKIVDHHKGTSTEFLGDGVLNLFDTEEHGLKKSLEYSMVAALHILKARETILNPFFVANGLPTIDLGIGIDHGVTIVTKFGYKNDTDLKAFGRCAYNVSRLCKGVNQIFVSPNSQDIWPEGTDGKLVFGSLEVIEGKPAYSAYIP